MDMRFANIGLKLDMALMRKQAFVTDGKIGFNDDPAALATLTAIEAQALTDAGLVENGLIDYNRLAETAIGFDIPETAEGLAEVAGLPDFQP